MNMDKEALIASIGDQGRIEPFAVSGWIERYGLDAARHLAEAGFCRMGVFNIVVRGIWPNMELMDAVNARLDVDTYYRANPQDMKALSEPAFQALLASDTEIAGERTRELAYLVLRHSDKPTELNYIRKLGRLKNTARIRSQAPGGKLYQMALPYLGLGHAEHTDRSKSFDLNDRELATVLAALRLRQRDLADEPRGNLDDIATNDGEFDALDLEEIDALCERLNVPGESEFPVNFEKRSGP